MTANRRIFLNIVATYGRSLYALVLGLFTGRWVLMALGESDYGLYGVVAGLTVFIAFFNGLLSSAIARFFAYSIGKDSKNGGAATLECQQWFNTALMIHTVVPTVLMLVGYPLGDWAVRNWLTIPPERIGAFVQVFRCVCVSCFVAMVNIPFSAMYTAKQYIAELTIYGVVANTCQACFLYYIASHSGDWLVRYAVWTCFLAVAPQLIICIRALKVFPECKIDLRLCWDTGRLKQLCYFAGSLAFGGLGGMLRGQGMAILVNKYFGPSVNAAMSVANAVNGQSSSLVAAMQGAFTPAIVQACGAGDEDLMRKMAFRACKFGMLLVLIFAIPLGIEIDNVMTLWLKNPPAYSAGLCLCMLALVAADKISIGHMIAVNAKGKIAAYQFFLGGALILTLPVAWLFVELNLGVYSIGVALLLMSAISSLGRVWFARRLAGMSAVYWIRKVVAPIALTILVSVLLGLAPRLLCQPSFLRLCATTLTVELVLLPVAWLVVLDKEERDYVVMRLRNVFRRFIRRNGNDEASLCFGYDADRFVKYSGGYGDVTSGKLLAKMIKEYHVLEKCLTMPERASGHGKTAAKNLLASIKRYEALGYERKDAQFLHSIGVLKAYVQITSADSEGDAELESLLASYPDVPVAYQPHYSRLEFYSGKLAPFPEFVASRHTVRHFSPHPVSLDKIRAAVACACNSPSACNRQYTRVMAILDREKIRKVLELQGGSRGFGHLATALLIVTVDLQGVGSVKERNDVYTNGGMFMMSLCYAMHYYEIAHCVLNWSKTPDEDRTLRKLLPIPQPETVVAVIVCGEAPTEFDVAMSPKKTADQVLTVIE